MENNIFNKLSFISLFSVIVLLPVFFLPFTNIPVEISKGLLLVVGLTLSIIFWAIARFFDGNITVPKSSILLGGVGVVLVLLISTIFAESSQVSLFGTMLDIGTFWFIFAAFLLMLMSSLVFRDLRSATVVLFGTIISSMVVLVFQAFRLFLPEVLSFGVLGGATSNILGSWNTLGFFAGFTTLSVLLVIEFFSTTKIEKWVLQGFVLLSLLFIALVNAQFVWEIIGLSGLVIFVYKLSVSGVLGKGNEGGGKKGYFPTFSFIVILISLMFFISGQFIGGILPNALNISNTEIRPSLISTIMVTKSVLDEHPILGLGPNRFEEAWAMHKPASVNAGQFWNTSFDSGSGLLPTFMATTGYLGILAWLTFFVLLIVVGVKSIFTSVKKGTNWEAMAFFVLSLYLFFASFFYSTGSVIFLLAFAYAGVFVGLSTSRTADSGLVSFSFLDDHRKSFFSMLVIVMIIIISASVSFKYIERFASVSYFRNAFTTPDASQAEESIRKAVALYPNDLYLRTYTQVYLIKFNSLVGQGDELPEEEQATLQASLDQARAGAQQAILYNPKNYLNFQSLGSVYQVAVALGVQGASYSQVSEQYRQASALNPLNPRLKLTLANIALADDKMSEAKEYANEAISLKSNYTDGLLLLAQISRREGNNREALDYARRALSFAPLNQDLIAFVDSLESSSSSGSSADAEVDSNQEGN